MKISTLVGDGACDTEVEVEWPAISSPYRKEKNSRRQQDLRTR